MHPRWSDVRVVLCDLDGVVWLARQAIPGSPGAIERLRASGRRVLFVTNNSMSVIADQEAALAAIGVPAAGDVVTSAQAAASLVRSGETVLVCGGPGLVEAVGEVGARVVRVGEADAVVVGLHQDFDYGRLQAANAAIRGGARFIATNDDPTFPTPDGPIPGAGSLVAAVGSYLDGHGVRHPAWPARPGSMGRAYPGHRIAVIDDDGNECPRGTPGDVAVHRLDVHGDPDPVFFLGYWGNEAATRAKFTGDPAASWCRTGDTAVMDEDGYLWYQGRSDDIFKAAGYRIGPSEIENCLVKHPAVANAVVVPKPDAERGAVVKAYVVLAPGQVGDDALVRSLQQHVRGQLAPYEYPKEIEFIDALPMTTTGKVQRRVLRLQEEARWRASGQG